MRRQYQTCADPRCFYPAESGTAWCGKHVPVEQRRDTTPAPAPVFEDETVTEVRT